MKGSNEKKRYRLFHNTRIRELKVAINYTQYANGQIHLSGYGIDAAVGLKLTQLKERTRTAPNEEQRAYYEHILIEKITADFEKNMSEKKMPCSAEHPFSEAFNEIPQDQRQYLCPPQWRASSTRTQHLSYFINICEQYLDPCGDELSAEDLADIVRQMEEKTAKHKNSSQNPARLVMTTERHIESFNSIYKRLREMSDRELPEIELPCIHSVKQHNTEQCKAISEDVRVRMAALLLENISNGLALGGVIMMTGAARPAEACALKFGELIIKDDYVVSRIIWQVSGGKRVSKLKTESSYRTIIMPKFTADCIRLRMKYLRSLGYSDAEIMDMYTVTKWDDPTVMANPRNLSEYLRKFLILAGCDSAFMESAEALMRSEPEMVGENKQETDVCAYILRRNCCTMYVNACGMDPDLVDVLMGHELIRKSRKAWELFVKQSDNWPVIAAMMERVIFDPEHSANPTFRPVDLGTVPEYHAEGQIRFVLTTSCEAHYHFSIETMEAGDSVMIRNEAKDKLKPDVIAIEGEAVLSPPIGSVMTMQEYNALKKQSGELDMSEFIPALSDRKNKTASEVYRGNADQGGQPFSRASLRPRLESGQIQSGKSR